MSVEDELAVNDSIEKEKENEKLKKVLNDLSNTKLNYPDTIDFESKITPKSEELLLNGLTLIEIPEDNKVRMLLSRTNSSLSINDHFILLDKDTFVTNVAIQDNSTSHDSLAITVINQKGMKIQIATTPDRITTKNGKRIYIFQIHDTVRGFSSSRNISLSYLSAIPMGSDDLTRCGNRITEVRNQLDEIVENIKSDIENAVSLSTNMVIDRQNHLDQVSQRTDSLQKEKQRLSAYIHKEKEILKAITEDVKHQQEIEQQLVENRLFLTQSFSDDKVKLAKQEQTLKSKERDQIELQIKLDSASKSLTDKTKELEEMDEKLSKGTAKADTYTRDLSGHMKESRIQLFCYAMIALALIGVTSFIFWEIYERASSLISSFNTGQGTNVVQLLLSRSPLIIASTVLLTGFLALLYFIVNHIISLNKDRMNMLKASVLAEQISVSLANDFDMKRAERIEQSKKLKVDIIMKLFESQQPTSKLDAKNMSVMTQAIDTVMKVKKQTK